MYVYYSKRFANSVIIVEQILIYLMLDLDGTKWTLKGEVSSLQAWSFAIMMNQSCLILSFKLEFTNTYMYASCIV